MTIWQCPHYREFLESIWEELQKGDHHLVIQLPAWQIGELRDAIYAFYKRYHYSMAFPVSEANISPEEYLRQCALEPDSFSLDNLTERKMVSENILLALPEDMEEEAREKWNEFFDKLSSDAREYQKRFFGDNEDFRQALPLPWRLLALMPTHFPSPKPETSLEIFLGSGMAMRSDLEYAIESCLMESNIRRESSRLWLKAICQGLGTRDVGLCRNIFEFLPLDLDEVMEMLKACPFPEMDEAVIRAVIAIDEGNTQNGCSFSERQNLRDYGILENDCENMERLHPVALARANRPYSVYRLLLQGQIRTYLPMVQEVQAFIHEELERLCGSGWHTMESEKYPGLAMEIGPLAGYMSRWLKGCCGYDLLNLAFLWRDLRNNVAHGVLLDYEHARDAVDLYEALSRL